MEQIYLPKSSESTRIEMKTQKISQGNEQKTKFELKWHEILWMQWKTEEILREMENYGTHLICSNY